jgi:glycosyltransferase involved in cell wall biosynthesis
LHIYAPAARQPSRFLGKLRTLKEPFAGNVPPEMRDDFQRACARGYDILQLENIQGGAALGRDMPRVLASVHVLHLIELRDTGFQSLDFFLKTKLLYRFAEKRLLRRFGNIRVLSDRMAEIVREINPKARVYTVPIAIDPSAYELMAPDRSDRVVGLIGHMGMLNTLRASTRLLRTIWPRVRARVPDARLLIAGWDARNALAQFVEEPGVIIEENLPSASSFFARCSVLAYPLPLGAGLHGKILEAMAYGVPVVTSTAGVEGVDAENGVHLIVEDDDDRFS